MAQVALVWARSHNFTNILIGARSPPEQLSPPLLETDAFSLDEGEKKGCWMK